MYINLNHSIIKTFLIKRWYIKNVIYIYKENIKKDLAIVITLI